jgi:thiamine-phosphate pyrophosphorylase
VDAPILHGLYAITDASLSDENLTHPDKFEQAIEQALLGGARIIQYRDKSDASEKRLRQAQLIRQICDRYNATFIINDDVALAKQCAADGVHLGKDDAAIAIARNTLGETSIIGVSCYDQLPLAFDAQAQGADYVAFGAAFASPTKPGAASASRELLLQAKQQLSIPVCAIGGITPANAAELVPLGIDMLAVISSIFQADDIQQAAAQLSRVFG